MGMKSMWLGLIPILLQLRPVPAQDITEIIARHLQARGGEAKIRALNSLRITGNLKSMNVDGQFEMLQKRPDKIRQQHIQQGKKLLIGYDGKQAWALDTGTGSEAPFVLKGIQAELLLLQSDFDGVFLDWGKKGHKIVYVGAEIVNSTKTHHLKILRSDGKVQHFFLDVETALERKISLELKQEGSPLVLESLLSNHKQVGGISFPHTIESLVNGRSQSLLQIDKIELDPGLEDHLFKMPSYQGPAGVKGKTTPGKEVAPPKPPKAPPSTKN